MNETNESKDLATQSSPLSMIKQTQENSPLTKASEESFNFLSASSYQMQAYLSLVQGQSKESNKTGMVSGMLCLKQKDPALSIPVSTPNTETQDGYKFPSIYIAWRPKAVLLKGNSLLMESFDPNSENFRRICSMPKAKGNPDLPNPMYGTETLHWIPKHTIFFNEVFEDKRRKIDADGRAHLEELMKYVEENGGIFATFFWSKSNKDKTCGGPTSQGGLEPGTPLMIGSKLIENDNYSWYTTPYREILDHLDPDVKSWYDHGMAQVDEARLVSFLNPISNDSAEVRNDSEENFER